MEAKPGNHLHSVTELDGSTIHPLFKDAPAIINVDTTTENPTFSVTFDESIAADALLGLLAEPLRKNVENFNVSDVRRGLRSFKYPNSRVMKNANALGSGTKDALRSLRPQVVDLLDVIDHPLHHQMLPARMRVLEPILAEFDAHMELSTMKPSQIRSLCDQLGIDVNEVAMRREKGGDRRNETRNVNRFGVDSNPLIEHLLMSKYVEKITIPGDEYTLLPKEELPNVSWARQPGYIERVKQLPHDKHLLGDRWEVLLREENTPRHVVRPRLSWRTDVEDYQRTWLDRTAEYHRQRYHWSAYRTHFVYDTVPPMYDPETHTIIHTSSLLGPVALASQLQSRDLTPDFITLVDGKLRQYWSSEPRPAKAAGYLVGLLQSQFIETQLFGTPGFQAVNKHVKAVTAPRG